MKSARLFILLFFIPITFHAQKTLTGLWTGTLSNDSITVRRDQSFEIVLTQYKQKVYGYSRATFIVNDTLYYIVKRVKGTIENDVCEVIDDEIISFNFRGKIDKGIRVTHTFHMNKQDSTWSLSGDWTTNKTKKFYSLSGKVDLKDEPDIEKSKIMPHLEELDLAKDVPFYAEAKKKAADDELRRIAATSNTKKNPPAKPVKPDPRPSEAVIAAEKKSTTQPVVTNPEPVRSEPVATVTQKPATNQPTTQQPVTTNTQKPVTTQPTQQQPVAVVEEKKPTTQPVTSRPEPVRSEPVATVTQKPAANQPTTAQTTQQPVATNTQKPVTSQPTQQQPVAVAEEKKPTTQPVTSRPEPVRSEPVATVTQKPTITQPAGIPEKKTSPVFKEPAIISPIAAVNVNQRKTAPPQEVSFVSDSLTLSLYDNGEIDGDTVSVLMNGELILAKQGLKASAIKKTIYMPAGTDEVTLLLYAENLGKYPPNTGLLVVYDGEERYQIRFSADLQQNASVIFRRKRK